MDEGLPLDELAVDDWGSTEDEDSAIDDEGSDEEVCVDDVSVVVEATVDDTVEVVSAGTVSVDVALALLTNVSVCVGLLLLLQNDGSATFPEDFAVCSKTCRELMDQ